MGRIATVAAVALAVVLSAEAAARVLDDRLPEPRVWHSYEAQVKADQMSAASAFGTVDVAFVGSSMMDTDLDPLRLHDAFDIVGYNAALGQASPRVLEPWVTEVVLPRLHPGVIVVGITSFDLTDPGESRRQQLHDFEHAPAVERLAGRRSVVERADDELGDVLALWRLRTVLRDPGTVVDAIRGRDTTPPDVGVVGPGGMATVFRDGVYADRPPGPETALAAQLTGFEVGGPDVDALRRLVDVAGDEGTKVVFAIMPVTPAFLVLHERPDDYTAFRSGAERLAAELGAPIVDLDAFPALDDTGLFADAVHLNRAGATVFTDAVGAILKDLDAGGR